MLRLRLISIVNTNQVWSNKSKLSLATEQALKRALLSINPVDEGESSSPISSQMARAGFPCHTEWGSITSPFIKKESGSRIESFCISAL